MVDNNLKMRSTGTDMYRYSPLPIDSYRLPGHDKDETSVILESDRADALWNLFWLSVPTIDHIPELRDRWWTKHKPLVGALSAIICDVMLDEVIYRKLLMHPQQFHDWFRHEDASIYDTYGKLGGDLWRTNVLARSQQAADRLIGAHPPVTTHGNVIRVNFGAA